MADARYVLSIGLAAATLAVVLPFLQGALATVPGFVSFVTQSGLAPALSLWFGPVIPLLALALAAAAFAVSWGRRSFLVVGLLAAGGLIFAVTSMIATEFFAIVVVPGPILGVVFGLAIFALGVAKGVMSARRTETVAAR
jgi:hypothetical protein